MRQCHFLKLTGDMGTPPPCPYREGGGEGHRGGGHRGGAQGGDPQAILGVSTHGGAGGYKIGLQGETKEGEP